MRRTSPAPRDASRSASRAAARLDFLQRRRAAVTAGLATGIVLASAAFLGAPRTAHSGDRPAGVVAPRLAGMGADGNVLATVHRTPAPRHAAVDSARAAAR